MQEIEESRLQISHTLQSCLQSDGRRRYATPPQQIAAFNRRSTAEILETSISPYLDVNGKDIIIGDDVIHLNPNGEFNVHFPIRRGELNLHSGVGGSLTAVMSDLQDIWQYVLKVHLGINLKWALGGFMSANCFFIIWIVFSDLNLYKAVLVVPDIYNRGHLRELMTLMLTKMGFGSCFLVQVSYGAVRCSWNCLIFIAIHVRTMWLPHSVPG